MHFPVVKIDIHIHDPTASENTFWTMLSSGKEAGDEIEANVKLKRSRLLSILQIYTRVLQGTAKGGKPPWTDVYYSTRIFTIHHRSSNACHQLRCSDGWLCFRV